MKYSRDNVLFGSLLVWTFVATGITGGIQVSKWHAASRARAEKLPVTVKNWRDLAGHGFATGAPNSAVTIVIFSDFECPFCRRFAGVIDTLRDEHPEVRIVERHFPLKNLHAAAFDAALAAECARDAGRYAEIRHQMFLQQALVTDQQWPTLALASGITDTASFSQCLRDQRHGSAVITDIAAGEQAGVHGTPSVVINDSLFPGAMSLSVLRSKIAKLSRAP